MWIPTTRVAGNGAFVLLGLCIALAVGCARQRPVLYPNVHYKSVGQEVAGEDIDWCFDYAERHGAGPQPVQRAAGRTARGAAVGAAAGLTRALFDSGKPDPVVRGFVEQCLKDLGYQITGWR